jgi:transposase-like protein
LPRQAFLLLNMPVFAGHTTDRAADARRHVCARPPRQNRDVDLAPGGARRARRRPEALLAIRTWAGKARPPGAVLDDLVKRGRMPELIIADGAPGLEEALAALWPEAPVQRCTVHKHRNLLAHAPERLHEEISNDDRDMVYAATRAEVEGRHKVFIRKWRLKCLAVADSLEEAGDRLFTFTRFPPSQWKSIRTSNAIERLREEFHGETPRRPLVHIQSSVGAPHAILRRTTNADKASSRSASRRGGA